MQSAATKSILITGASSGIGAATAKRFLDAGWGVSLLGRRDDALNAVAGGHVNALCLPGEITDEGDVDAAFSAHMARFGRISALFNNAGVALPALTIDQVSLDQWRSMMDVNITGMFLAARAAFRHMRAQSPMGGRIINNGSISAHAPRPGSAPYTTSKHAVTGLTRSLSLDGRAFNIACGQIDIGNALTDMAAPMTRGVPQANGDMAVEPTMDVRHVAEAVLQMAELPEGVNTQFMTLMATSMPFIGRG